MPTNAGVPIQNLPITWLPGGAMNPVDWIDLGSPDTIDGAAMAALMRGHPGALSAYQRRQIAGPPTMAQGAPYYLQSRPYDRGAGAFSPKFGQIPTNPIGAGYVTPYKLPVIAGPGARYQMGAIWFDVQTVPTSLQMSPTMPIEAAEAIIATSHVAAMYPTTG